MYRAIAYVRGTEAECKAQWTVIKDYCERDGRDLGNVTLRSDVGVGGFTKLESRPGGGTILRELRPNDTLIVVSIDRISRDAGEFLRILAKLAGNHVSIHDVSQGVIHEPDELTAEFVRDTLHGLGIYPRYDY